MSFVFRIGREHPDVVDLTNDGEFVVELLQDVRRWRQRLVEEVHLSGANHSRVRSSYQVEFPPDIVERYAPGATRAKVLLPLTTKNKVPLIAFDAVGPNGGPALLHPRRAGASVQASYLAAGLALIDDAADLTAILSPPVLQALCYFTPGPLTELDDESQRLAAVAALLRERLGLVAQLADVEDLLHRTDATGARLSLLLGEPRDRLSSSEQFIFTVIGLAAMGEADARSGLEGDVPKPTSIDDVRVLLDAYNDAIASAPLAARNFLPILAEYGRRWELIIETEVPIGEPSEITLFENRSLERSGREFVQAFNFGDAVSGHLQIHVDDHAVELQRYTLVDALRPNDTPLSSSSSPFDVRLDGIRCTTESLAVYSSADTRPDFLNVRLRLRAARLSIVTHWSVVVLTFCASVLAFQADESDVDFVDTLALLTVPTTFAVAIVLTREQSALSVQVQRWSRRALVASLIVLWVAVIARLL